MAMNCTRARSVGSVFLLAWATSRARRTKRDCLGTRLRWPCHRCRCIAAPQGSASAASGPTSVAGPEVEAAASYVLGPDDVIAIKALDADEVNSPSVRVDQTGFISLPMLGRVMAGGFSVERLEKELSTRLQKYVKAPVVAVSVVEYRSQPVSVVGSVGQPGVHQLEGRKTLIEILAKAGGMRPEAGNTIKITRKAEWGPIPLASAEKDPSGQFTRGAGESSEHHAGHNPVREHPDPAQRRHLRSARRHRLRHRRSQETGGFTLTGAVERSPGSRRWRWRMA